MAGRVVNAQTRRLGWMLLLVAVVIALVVATRPTSHDETVDQRVQRIAGELRCPTCQGLSVAASPSETARLIRSDIRRMIDEGATDAEIEGAYVERYDEWVLLQPESRGLSALVWWLPAVFILGGAAVLVWRIKSRDVVSAFDERSTDERVRRARDAVRADGVASVAAKNPDHDSGAEIGAIVLGSGQGSTSRRVETGVDDGEDQPS